MFPQLVVLLALCLTMIKGLDEYGSSEMTKMEVTGMLLEWCEKDQWMVTYMTRLIECRNEVNVSFAKPFERQTNNTSREFGN